MEPRPAAATAVLDYIEFHSTEDIRHAKVIDAMIRRVADRYPDRATEVKFGFDAARARVRPAPGLPAAASDSASGLWTGHAHAARRAGRQASHACRVAVRGCPRTPDTCGLTAD
jgi:hypothetical protein